MGRYQYDPDVEALLEQQGQEPAPEAPYKSNPMVKEYLMKKSRAPAQVPSMAEDSETSVDSGVMNGPEAKALSDYEKFNSEFNKDKYKEAQDDAENQKSGLGWAQFAAGVGDSLAGRSPSESARNFEGIRKNIDDRTTGAFDKRKASAVQDINTKKSFTEASRDEEEFKVMNDVNSFESEQARSLGAQMGMDPAKIKGMTAHRFKSLSPVTLKMFEIREKAGERAERRDERALLRDDRKNLMREKMDDKKRKDHEFNATQAKQMGLYSAGNEAEAQYKKSVADKETYDPTSSGQWIDNSNWAPNWLKNDKAIESSASKGAWIESFLRDASGAAIAKSERGSYEEIYFPQPGDTDDAVSNKEKLRENKMRSALVGAGHGMAQQVDNMSRQDMIKTLKGRQGQ